MLFAHDYAVILNFPQNITSRRKKKIIVQNDKMVISEPRRLEFWHSPRAGRASWIEREFYKTAIPVAGLEVKIARAFLLELEQDDGQRCFWFDVFRYYNVTARADGLCFPVWISTKYDWVPT